MSREIKAPHRELDPHPSVFLAGSIEMGAAEHWQERVVRMLDDVYVACLNPRRDDWDNSWVQDITCAVFNEQVNWELEHIRSADHVLIYFAPDTKAPITLAEMGYCLGAGLNPIVVCPPGFYRRGNVQIMCAFHKAELFDRLEDGVEAVRQRLKTRTDALRKTEAASVEMRSE